MREQSEAENENTALGGISALGCPVRLEGGNELTTTTKMSKLRPPGEAYAPLISVQEMEGWNGVGICRGEK